jgi:DNA processing protein
VVAVSEADDSNFEGQPDSLVHDVRLALIPGVGPAIRRALLDRFGSSDAVLSAAPSELRRVPGVGPKLTRKIVAASEEIDAETEIARCQQQGIGILTYSDERYPSVLREIHDPPGLLFVRGTLLPRDGLAIAIVGTRHATRYGLRTAQRLGESLARAGLVVVSGLARGVDSAAHRGALDARGRTLAVLGGGVLNVYPPEHHKLAEKIVASGALLSEAPPHAAPKSGVFPQRNRIISGLSLGVIIVEAAERSGALITARLAMEQGREVFAVPGPIDSRASRGCHRLLRDGAKLVETADDVLEELGPLFEPASREDGAPVHHPAELLLNELEQTVLGAVGGEDTAIDQIVNDTGLPVHRVLSTISVLEMRRLVRRISGTTVVRM